MDHNVLFRGYTEINQTCQAERFRQISSNGAFKNTNVKRASRHKRKMACLPGLPNFKMFRANKRRMVWQIPISR